MPLTEAEAALRLKEQKPEFGVPESVVAALRQAGHEAWLVGGTVRDLLLGRAAGDSDLATDATPDWMMAHLPHPVATGLRHGTVTSVVDGTHVEVTTFRTDVGYSDARHPDAVLFVRSIEEDLARRDLTINAMAFSLLDDQFRDPWGGLKDLDAGVVRAVGDPIRRFTEDGLRPLRAIRLAVQLGFDLEEATALAIPKALHSVRMVSPERVRDEFNKMLLADLPSRAIEMMRRTELLGLVLPEMLEGVGCHQNRWHSYDVYGHSLQVLDNAPGSKLEVRLAALLHDIAKPRTKVVVSGDGTFYNHQHVGSVMTRGILTRLRYPPAVVDRVSSLVDNHMFHYDGHWTDAAVRRFIKRVGIDQVADLFDLRLADSLGKGPDAFFSGDIGELRVRVEAELARSAVLDVSQLAIGGREVMEALNLAGGPAVGEALRFLLDRVIEDPARNTPEGLRQLLSIDYRKMT
ncbi:MAG: HD domain-containing protein [Candidatus Eisenbacteria bacterium]|nr:HD domain-containing protein [Candidatus Eisenbacteria bacterium]